MQYSMIFRLSLFLTCCFQAGAVQSATTVVFVSGEHLALRDGQRFELQRGMQLLAGDQLATGRDGRLQLRTEQGVLMAMRPNQRLLVAHADNTLVSRDNETGVAVPGTKFGEQSASVATMLRSVEKTLRALQETVGDDGGAEETALDEYDPEPVIATLGARGNGDPAQTVALALGAIENPDVTAFVGNRPDGSPLSSPLDRIDDSRLILRDGAEIFVSYGVGPDTAIEDFQVDESLGMALGRWVGGELNVSLDTSVHLEGEQQYDFAGQSLHWVTTEGYVPVQYASLQGTANFDLSAANPVTASDGREGQVIAASLQANFLAETVASTLEINLQGEQWQANGTGNIKAFTTFAGNYEVQTDNSEGQGVFSGIFTGIADPATAAPSAAGVAFSLQDGAGTTANGAIILSLDGYEPN